MSLKNSIKAIPLKSIASSGVSSSYAAINSTGLPNGCFLLRIINNSNEDITVSYDGSTDNEYVPTMTTLQLPVQSNAQPVNSVAVFPIGTIVYVKGTGGTGYVYLAGYYQPQGV